MHPPPEPSPPVPSLRARIVARWPNMADAVAGLDGQLVWVLTMAALILVLFRKFGGSTTYETILRPASQITSPYLSLYGDLYWFGTSFLMLGFIPLLLLLPRRARPSNLGLGVGDWRFALKVLIPSFVGMVIVVAIASRFSVFWRYYPLNGVIAHEAGLFFAGRGEAPEGFLGRFAIYEMMYGLYFIGWEYFYRGFLLFGLYDRIGVNAILVGNIPFALLHVSKPFPEALGSILAGIALGLFALRTRSFWYPWLLHVCIAWTMDAAAIQRRAEEILNGPVGG